MKTDAPTCAPNQQRIYGVAKQEQAQIKCVVDANPSDVEFKWTFNNSAESIDVANNHVSRSGIIYYTYSIILYTRFRNFQSAPTPSSSFSSFDEIPFHLHNKRNNTNEHWDHASLNARSDWLPFCIYSTCTYFYYMLTGTLSVVTYTPMTELDYGTLLCIATNRIGRQRAPCAFHVIAAGNYMNWGGVGFPIRMVNWRWWRWSLSEYYWHRVHRIRVRRNETYCFGNTTIFRKIPIEIDGF